MRILLRRVTTSDPTTFVTSLAAWAAIVGACLTFTDDFFRTSPAWDGLKLISPNDTMWGLLMLGDAILLVGAVRIDRMVLRATVTLFSSVMWGLLGMSLTYYGYKHHFMSIAGAFSLWCSIQGFFAVGRWSEQEREGV